MIRKLNNRGMTLVEILLSITILSVVMVSMYKLISDVNYNKKKLETVANNIIKINEIESKVQEYIINYYGDNSIQKITGNNAGTTAYFQDRNGNKLVSFEVNSSGDNSIIITVKNDGSSDSNEKESWTLDGYSFAGVCSKGNSKNIFNVIFKIKNNGSAVDDIIEIPYYHELDEGVSINNFIGGC